MSTSQYVRDPLQNLPNVSFLAYSGSSQVIVNGIINFITLEQALYNNGNYYDTSSGLFKPLVAGLYYVGFHCSWTAAFSSDAIFTTSIYKNETALCTAFQGAPINLNIVSSLNYFVTMDGVTDILSVQGEISGNSGVNGSLIHGQPSTYFSSFLVDAS